MSGIFSLIYSLMDSTLVHTNLKLLLLQYVIFLILILGLLYLAWKAAKHMPNDKLLNKYKWLRIIKSIVFAYFIGFLIFRTASTYFEPNAHNESSIWNNMFSALMDLEGFIGFFSMVISYLFNSIFSKEINLFVILYLPGIVLIFIAGHSLWTIIKHKKILFLRIGIIAYVLSLSLINAQNYEGKNEFAMEGINISKIVEKHEATIFYAPMKYFNHDDGKLFKYAANFEDGAFILQNNTGKAFTIEPNKIEGELNNQKFNNLVTKVGRFPFREDWKAIFNQDTGISSFDWPEDFTCEKKKFREESDSGGEPVYYYSENICEKLFYKNKLVFEDEYFSIGDVDFSDDGKWMMLIKEEVYDPDDVYLLKLAD